MHLPCFTEAIPTDSLESTSVVAMPPAIPHIFGSATDAQIGADVIELVPIDVIAEATITRV
jgi:hypothetical protein